MNPKWIEHCIPLGFGTTKGQKLSNGLFVCIYEGSGFIEKEPGDFYSQVKCEICKGTGQIPKRILDKHLK
jgi:DnaJ-class molecular chaperone